MYVKITLQRLVKKNNNIQHIICASVSIVKNESIKVKIHKTDTCFKINIMLFTK